MFWECNVFLLRGVGEIKEYDLEYGILLIIIINCKGMLFNGILEDEFVKFLICKVIV